MIFIKIHKSYRNVVAVCDSELIGKTFEEEIKQLECRESFYKGKSHSLKEATQLIKEQSAEDSTFNIVGPNSVKAAIEAGVLESDSIGKIKEIPYALVLL